MGMQCWNGMGGNGNGNDSMRVGREWEQDSHSRTPLVYTYM